MVLAYQAVNSLFLMLMLEAGEMGDLTEVNLSKSEKLQLLTG